MIDINEILRDLTYFYPEIVLTVAVLFVLIADLIPNINKKLIIPLLSLAGLLLSMIFSFQLFEKLARLHEIFNVQERFLFSNMIIVDHLSVFFRVFFALSSAIIVLLSIPTFKRAGEYYALLLVATLGMYLMASSTHIIMIALSLEIVGIACYVLAGYRRSEHRSSEAALKYMLYGAVSTGIMLYGFSFLYGISGEVNIYKIRETLMLEPVDNLLLLVSVIFVLAGIGYKIAMVPFHFWCPDVFEGAPTPITTFFSVGPKVAGVALLIRFIFAGISVQVSETVEQWISIGDIDLSLVLAVLSAVTMTLGNTAALGQRNLKRLLAYSSIAHAGYILMGFTMFTGAGINAVLFYVIVYLFMNFGAFIVVDGVALRLKSENIDQYRGLASRAPYLCFALTVFLISLTGIPPTAGFIGKVLLFAAVIDSKLYWLAVIGAVNVVVSLYYYFRIVKAMYLEKSISADDSALAVPRMHIFLITFLLIPTIYFGLFWSHLLEWTTFSFNFMLSID